MSLTTILALSLGLGIPLFVGGLLYLILGGIRRMTARMHADLEREGIVLDSGTRWVTIRFSNFRAPGLYRGAGITKTRLAMVLTRERFAFIPSRRQFSIVSRGDLGRFRVAIDEDGALQVHSDNPPNASGTIDYRVKVDDPSQWVRALSEAGARTA